MPTITLTLDVGDPLTLRVLDVLGLRVAPPDHTTMRERVLTALNGGPANVRVIRERVAVDGLGSDAPRQQVANLLQQFKREGIAVLDGREWRRVPR
jgi:hypothetical protein